MKTNPRGIRNNNPGNIRWGAPWQGLVPEDQRTDKDFCQFIAPAWGIRALCRILITYQDNYGINTIRGIISKWAPPSENDTQSYIAAVSISAGKGADQPLDVHTYDDLFALAVGIIQHENGQQPYDVVTLEKGLQLAGVVKQVKTALGTRIGKTIAGFVSVGALGAGASGYTQFQPVISAIGAVSTGRANWDAWLKLLGAGLAILAVILGIVAFAQKQHSVKAEGG